MSGLALARQLFEAPGAGTAHTRHLLAQAAGAHARLLALAGDARQEPLDRMRETLWTYLRSTAPAQDKRSLLDDPLLIEALHTLATSSVRLTEWDATVAPGCDQTPAERRLAIGRGRLGNVVAALLWRRWRNWTGTIELATDSYGRIHFPFCDWALVLTDEHSEGRDLFADQTVMLHLGDDEARCELPGSSRPLVRMPRRTFDAMFVDNRPDVHTKEIECCVHTPRARFERASRLGKTRVRFEPISGNAPAAHAELTGGIVTRLLAAMLQNAPDVHGQFCQCIRTIHGFELPPHACGQIASFSLPTTPGVVGFNVQYTLHDEPRLSPYCFMWLGHELGHTVHYLIDDIAYTHGWRFLENPGDKTAVVARYGRSLNVRTLFQIPYVHLYEWWLLMRFYEQRFAGLPWNMFDDVVAVGDDVRDEIEESFELIRVHARLTPIGEGVMRRMRELAADAAVHWRRLSRRARHVAAAN